MAIPTIEGAVRALAQALANSAGFHSQFWTSMVNSLAALVQPITAARGRRDEPSPSVHCVDFTALPSPPAVEGVAEMMQQIVQAMAIPAAFLTGERQPGRLDAMGGPGQFIFESEETTTRSGLIDRRATLREVLGAWNFGNNALVVEQALGQGTRRMEIFFTGLEPRLDAGRVYEAADVESLLDAAVRWGMTLEYPDGIGGIGYARYVGNPRSPNAVYDAEKKAFALLKDWLSPEQLDQYQRTSAFDVIGSASKKRYRVTSSDVFNVVDTETWQEYCFVPVGAPARGDKMLAQKIALETDEEAALAVAHIKHSRAMLRFLDM
jgi:hypothetical protein